MITLGIIGVVAAMTMPSLIAKHQKQVTVNRLKKTYSVLANIIRMSENYNGEMSQWDFPQNSPAPNEAVEFLNKYYAPYAESAKVYKGDDFRKQYDYLFTNNAGKHPITYSAAMTLADGTVIAIYPNIPNGYIWLFADINGFQKPNKIGRDVFVFDVYKYANQKYELKFWGNAFRRDQLTKNPEIPEEEKDSNASYYECNKGNVDGNYSGFYCGAVIQRDGWQISDDYPW